MHDLRYAFRLVRRQPLFAALVIATLTLGLGASTSMFAVVNGVLIERLPYLDPAGLVWAYGAFRSSDSAAVSPPDFLDYRSRNSAFERLGAMAIAPSAVTVTGSGAPERLQASRVSAELITTLGIAPLLGRDFARADETTGAPAVIISHRLWQQRYGLAPGVLGEAIVVDERPLTIVAVMPPDFVLPYDNFIRLTDPVDLYLPIAFDDPDARIRRFHSLRLIGRLHPSVSLEQAQAEMDVIARQLEAAYPENETWHLRLVPLQERIVGGVRPVLLVLMASVTLLLLVACANVASLLLARASTRERELAVRGALGASRARIVRQQLVEGFVLCLAGSIGAVLLTWCTIEALKRFGPSQFPRLQAVELDPFVIAYAFAAAGVTTVIFALAPAIHAARRLGTASMSARAATHDRSTRRGQRAIVVAQLAISTVLLATAAVLVRGFVRLTSTETGFTADSVVLTRLALPLERYNTDNEADAYYSHLLERLAADPDIDAAALGTAPPLSGANDTIVYREGRPPTTAADQRFSQIRWIQGDYFRALGIPFLSGRGFDQDSDRRGRPPVAIINRRAARDYFGSGNPLGQHLVVDLGNPVTVQVVGVTGDVRTFGQLNEAPPMLYLHARQHSARTMQVVARAAAIPTRIESTIRRHVQALDPILAVSRVERLDALLSDSVSQPRFATLLMGTFAAVAVILAIIGLYGTLAYMVSRRRREIGIRLAVGGTGKEIRRMFLRQGAAMIALGLSLGLAGSHVASTSAAALLFAVEPAGPLLLAGVAALSGLMSFVAVIVPARRASRVEPLTALRVD